ncbi:M50 family metallopeptidase [Neobacillus sp. DY30]|uniref:M50 family metallopeptidase n=1 Tax=Neobacillus sp. DY30 TaxID=3047871 RepID=UPI0024BFB88E|nr:M50 family metallopeptidase [Neobacillus sp. DY30]WHX98833.1 M50 family metallopeptidase [Neobacillus sp. DY30]
MVINIDNERKEGKGKLGYLKEKLSMKFFLFIGLALVLVKIPLIGDYFRIINTVIHESGHAFIALIGGNIESISLYMNADGVTHGTESVWIINFITCAAGYTIASFLAYASFLLIKKKKHILFVDLLLGVIIINLILWVRNPYGLFWLASFGLLFLAVLIKGSKKVIHNLVLLIASVLLVESVSTAYDILIISMIQPHAAGDATNLSQLTGFIPAQGWGVFFFAQALFFVVLGFKKGLFSLGKGDIQHNYQLEGTKEY